MNWTLRPPTARSGCGDKDELDRAYNAWIDYLEQPDGVGEKLIEINGVMNDCTRSRCRTVVLAESVRSMVSFRY